MEALQKINAVEGFDPSALAVEYTDLNSAGGSDKRLRLPVMAQIGWFRLKYPEGRIAVSVAPVKDCFVATARVYPHYSAPVEQFLAEATASRGYLADKLHSISGLASINSDKSLVRTKIRILCSGTGTVCKSKGNYLKNSLIRATASDLKSS